MNNSRGQSIIEVIIAISVIVVGILAIMSLNMMNSRGNKFNTNYLIGNNLAREGIEAVRNIRDSNWVLGNDWNNGLSAGKYIIYFDYSSNKWAIKSTTDTIGNDFTNIYRLTANNLYLQDTNTISSAIKTNWSRLITVSEIKDGDAIAGIKVVSEVLWAESGSNKTIKLEDNLFNWR